MFDRHQKGNLVEFESQRKLQSEDGDGFRPRIPPHQLDGILGRQTEQVQSLV